jgi:flagellar basal body L-ring protein FlgH
MLILPNKKHTMISVQTKALARITEHSMFFTYTRLHAQSDIVTILLTESQLTYEPKDSLIKRSGT